MINKFEFMFLNSYFRLQFIESIYFFWFMFLNSLIHIFTCMFLDMIFMFLLIRFWRVKIENWRVNIEWNIFVFFPWCFWMHEYFWMNIINSIFSNICLFLNSHFGLHVFVFFRCIVCNASFEFLFFILISDCRFLNF